MNSIDMRSFLEVVEKQSLTDILMGVELLSDDEIPIWGRMEGGAIVFCFDEAYIIFNQPIGRTHIDFYNTTPIKWANHIKAELPESILAFTRIYETAVYRKTLDLPPAKIDKVSTAVSNNSDIWAVIFTFDTGGTMGIESSSYGGLTCFYDDQYQIFRAECISTMNLTESIAWKRP